MADDKALIASSEFDPSEFLKGFDAMVNSVTTFSEKEQQLQAHLQELDKSLKVNSQQMQATRQQIEGLDKSSTTYSKDLSELNKKQGEFKKEQRDLSGQFKAATKDMEAHTKETGNLRSAYEKLGATTKTALDGKGKGLFDTTGINRQVADVISAGGKLKGLFGGKIDDSELVELEHKLAATTDEFKQLATVVEFVKSKMATLDPNSEEFAELAQVVEVAEATLQKFGEVQEKVGKSSQSLRGRLNELRTSMVALEEQGKENTPEFQKMQLEAAKLADAIADAQQRIRVLASDTRHLDFGIGLIRGLAAAYGIAAGTAEIFGLKSEDVMQTIARLNAVMAILNGLQELQNLLQKQSVVAIVGQEIATKAAAIAQRVYAIAVGTSTGAMRAFRVALLATGIGAFIVALGLAAEAMGVFDTEIKASTDSLEGWNDVIQDGIDLMEIRLQSVKLNAALDEERARQQITNETALNNRLTQIRQKAMEDERQELLRRINVIRLTQDDFLNKGLSGDFIDKSNQQITQLFKQLHGLEDQLLLDRNKAITRQLDEQRKAYQAYIDRLIALQRRLRDITLAGQPQDADAIRQALTNTFNDALDELDKDVRDGKLTQGRANILGKVLEQITAAETDQQITDFRLRAADALRSMNDTLLDLQAQSSRERAELLRNDLVRQAELISQAMEQERDQLLRERDQLLRDIAQTQREGLISPEVAEENAAQVMQIFEQLLTNLTARTGRQLEALTGTAFQELVEGVQRQFAALDVSLSESATQEIVVLAQRFAAGRISYESYQKELTAITRRESLARINQQLKEAEALLAVQQQRIREIERANALLVQGGDDVDLGELDALRDEENNLRNQISALRRQLSDANTEGLRLEQTELGAKIAIVAQYAQAIGNVVAQVVAFWQAANAAEQQALERSIALQETRVAAATQIAERGNAEYLRLEEDRLREVQLKQENAARRQLAINAVLQTSQALTAFVSALAQGVSTGGPLGGIAVATAVLALLASGYAIVQNLQQNNAQRLFEGTKEVKGNGYPDGVDTVPALLTKGEAVVPADKNKKYKPAIAAIIDETIPADALNQFVMNYKVPAPDFARMDMAAENSIAYGTEIIAMGQRQNRLIEEQNSELRLLNKQFAAFGIDVHLDKNGFAVATMKAVEALHIASRT